MKINKKILWLALAVILIILLFLYFYLRKPKQATSLPESKIQTISTEDAGKPQMADGKVLFIDKTGTLAKIDPSDNSQAIAYKPTGSIVDYYPAPDGSKIIVAEKVSDDIKNYLISDQGKQEVEHCLAEAINFINTDKIIANCIKQVDEFDPDTINNIQISDPTVKKVSKTIDINFRFDGLKAIYSDGKTATLLTKNNGYDNNDIYSVNLESGVFKNLTNNGFVREVKKVDSNYLYLTKEGENPGVVNVLLGNGSKKELIASESLNLFTLNKNNLVTIDKKNNLVVSDLEKGSESISAMSLGESIGEINYLLAEDSNIIIFSSAGIFKVNI